MVAIAPAAAPAQQDDQEDQRPPGGLVLEEIVVTGRAGPAQVSQFESSVAITTFNSEALREKSPLSPADLYLEIPGFWSEASGGEVGNNVFPRGLPQPGSFRFLKLQEDGLPIMEIQELAFVNADTLLRIDETVQRVEAVRGGTAALFASNAAGGIINHITKKGTQDFEGVAKVSWGDFGHYRFDTHVAGPASDELLFSIGGFFRSNEGIRDPGFVANRGGQVRGNMSYLFDGGEFEVSAKYVDEENIFYLPIPLQRDPDDPEDIRGIEGFDPNFDTLTTDSARFVSLLRPGGTVVNRDLQDGVNTEYVQFGTKLEWELDEWTVVNRNRYTDGDVLFNAIFSLSNPSIATDFLAGQLSAMQDEFGPGVVAAEFRDAETGAVVTNPANLNGNGLVIDSGWWTTFTQFENFMNDLQVNRQVSLAGAHSITLGLYFSDVDVQQLWNFNSVLQEVTGAPRLLDVIGLDAAGNDVAAATLSGFTGFGGFYRNTTNSLRQVALYAYDEWQVAAIEGLRVDFGLRFQSDEIEGRVEELQDFSLEDNPLSPEQSLDADAIPTLADDSGTFGAGRFIGYEESFEEVNWAVGANYTVNDWLAFYARYNEASRTPDFDDFAGNPQEGFPVQDVKQAEGGIKIDLPYLSVFGTFFYSELSNIPFNDEVIVDGQIITLDLVADATNPGVEIQSTIGPFFNASLNITTTYQNPEFENFDVFNGNQVVRIPKLLFSASPEYRFFLDDASIKVFGDYTYVGDRFTDFGNTNLLPDYQTVSAGLVAYYENWLLEFHANNLTNSIGLTEGNPRSDQFAPAGGALFNARPVLGRSFRLSIGYEF